MSFIPKNRPVLGKDLDVIRQMYGLTSQGATYLFGLSMTRWMYAVRRDADLPVADATLALLVRFMDENPDIRMLPKFPSASEFHKEFDLDGQMERREFAVMMGAEASASYRWLTAGSRQSPAAARLLWCLTQLLQKSRSRAAQASMLKDWRSIVEAEATARGAPDVFETGRWPQYDTKEREKVVRVTKRSLADAAKGEAQVKSGRGRKSAAEIAELERLALMAVSQQSK